MMFSDKINLIRKEDIMLHELLDAVLHTFGKDRDGSVEVLGVKFKIMPMVQRELAKLSAQEKHVLLNKIYLIVTEEGRR